MEQVKKTTEASPGTTVWVYRNAIKVSLRPPGLVLRTCSPADIDGILPPARAPHSLSHYPPPRPRPRSHHLDPPPNTSLQALPWYTSVREKVTDPAYSAWFMKFSAAVIANHSTAHVRHFPAQFPPF